jgi:two-component system sensor histidine kinase CpxA
MKTISLKVTVWSVAVLVISLAAFLFIGDSIIRKSGAQNFTQINRQMFRLALAVYHSDGRAGLAHYMQQLNEPGGTQYSICDASGHDLETGEDRSELIGVSVGKERPYRGKHNRLTMGLRSDDGRYIWLATSAGPSAIQFAPFYIPLLVTVVVLYWLVTMYIARPVRQLANVVDRFGAGELTARATPGSSDEIGNLGRSFNSMAERIHTLLTTERQLLQDVSHELRSPLARLTFEAEMVRRTTDRDASATRLRHEIERLSELVGTLIDMARAEGEPGEVEMQQLSLNDLLLATVEDSEVEALAAGCRIDVKAAEEMNLPGNAELLRRAIENVVRNAIRYAPPESTVEVRLERKADCARITVRDYGPGIPEKLGDRIFDPFFRADSSRDERTGGLGLGLAIARRAVRVHRGDITAANASPGALLTIRLPLHPEVQ